jgi:PST family polysaccharide transporter
MNAAQAPSAGKNIGIMPSSLCDDQLSSPPQQPSPRPTAEKHTYGQILKSSALVGGSSGLNIVIGIVRTKAMAMLLGPAGFGLAGVYGSIADLAQNIAGVGINSSGVRQIAEAVASNDTGRIGLTISVLRRTSIVLGVLGAALLVLFSGQVSTLTFSNNQHGRAISVLSIVVLLKLVSGGQSALIQGTRRIADFAKVGVLSALFGTVISIPIIYFLREKGVVLYLVAVAATTLVTSWWYSRKIQVPVTPIPEAELRREAAGLLKLGFAFMSSGLMTMGVAYVVRIALLRKVGVEATGLYQSAWVLGGLYISFILQAMGADFYPRLTAHSKDNTACNRLVNEQARVGLLLAGPGVIATLTFAPVVIALFYTAKFGNAVGILRWICLGTTLQVITWPMGFIILAKGKQKIFFWSEVAWAAVSLALAWVCVRWFGLNGAGIAFFGSYVFHGFLTYPIARHLSGFRWSGANRKTGMLFLFLIAFVFCASNLLPFPLATSLGVLAVLLSTAYSIRVLVKLVSLEQIPRPMLRLLAGLGFVPSAATAGN